MIEVIIQWKDLLLTWCGEQPVGLFLAIAILPGCAFPVAPLLVLAGAVWGGNPSACLLTMSAIILNILWTHALASGPCRTLVIRLLGKRISHFGEMPRGKSWKVAFMLRITPGVPLFIQNYSIGVLGIPASTSVLLAIPITGAYVCGFVITGGAIFEGKSGLMIIGISLIIVTSLVINMLRRRYQSPVK